MRLGRIVAVLAGLTFPAIGAAQSFDSLSPRADLPIQAASGTLRADYGRVFLGDPYNLTVTVGGALDWSGSSGLAGYAPARGGSLVVQGYFASDDSSPGLVYQWTGNDKLLQSQIMLVPEPQAWLLLAAGLALMQIFRRRGGAHATGSA